MSGVVPICHNSGGPLYDFRPQGAFTFDDDRALSNTVKNILGMNDVAFEALSSRIRNSALAAFDRQHFIHDMKELISSVISE